jgi:Zn-dependent M28 family amino/carboxypeptidase
LTNELVVFSAHLDHVGTRDSDEGDVIYNGFFDNAVGVAIMLDSARALANLTVAPRRSIVFLAPTGEEAGLLGSDYFVNNPAWPDTSIVANVNVDLPMLIFPMNTITTFGAERTSFEEAASVEVASEGFEAHPYPYGDEEVGEIKRSDQYSFMRKGIPVVWMMEGVGSTDETVDGLARINAFYDDHYHQVSDDLSQPIDWDAARRFTRASTRISRHLAMEDEAPAWRAGDFYGEKFGKQ